jgi:Ca-activated chloride channel family protein
MSFLWPAMLGLLALVPAAAWYYFRLQRQRLAAARRSASWLGPAASRLAGWRRHLPPALFLGGLTLVIFALARPQAVVSLPRQEGLVILAFDVSGSMAADDLEPTRMEAAKAAATAFVERQPATVQIGVVAFSDSGFTVQAPTNDQAATLATLARLQPQRGTSLGHGILSALNTIELARAGEPPEFYTNRTPEPTLAPTPLPPGVYTSAVIVLLSDGENNENPDPLAVAQAAADRGVRIHTVGIGSPEGAVLHIEGFTIHSRLNEALLERISERTGGRYYNAQTPGDLLSIYENLDQQFVVKPEELELTSLLAGASLALWLAGGLLSLAWLGRLP